MNPLSKTLRHMLGWALRGLVLALSLMVGIILWVVTTAPGTQWALEKMMVPLKGHVTGIHGSLWQGLHIAQLTLRFSNISLDARDLAVQVAWQDLLQRRLHIRTLSVATLQGKFEALPAREGSTQVQPKHAVPAQPEKQALPITKTRPLAQQKTTFPLDIWLEKMTVSRITFAGQGQTLPFIGKNLQAQMVGNLEKLETQVKVQAVNGTVQLTATLLPQKHWPIPTAKLTLALPDRKVATATLIEKDETVGTGHRLQATLVTHQLNLAQFAGEKLPDTALTLQTAVTFDLSNQEIIRQVQIDGEIDPSSRWNKQPLAGHLRAQAKLGSQANSRVLLEQLHINLLNIHLQLGRNQLRAQGSLGTLASVITLNANVPDLGSLAPGWAGAVTLQAKVEGMASHHQAELHTHYIPALIGGAQLGQKPRRGITLGISVKGAWGTETHASSKVAAASNQIGWRGTLTQFQFTQAGFRIKTLEPVQAVFLPDAGAPLWQWQLDAVPILLRLPDGHDVHVQHAGSRGGRGRWETAGKLDKLTLTATTLLGMQRVVALALARPPWASSDRIKAIFPTTAALALGMSWDVHQTGVLAGRLTITRRSGDLYLPHETPVPLGLRVLSLDLTATPVSAQESQLAVNFNAVTAKMGKLRVSGITRLMTHAAKGISLADVSLMHGSLDADIENLQSMELWAPPGTFLGGSLQAHVQAQGGPGGAWRMQGTVRGKSLQVIRIDEGVRLLGGTLDAHFHEDQLIIDSLRFPATLPKIAHSARLDAWMALTPQAQNSYIQDGFIQARGKWRLAEGAGKVQVVLHHFPIVQRIDRYIIASGQVTMEAALPRFNIFGAISADAGWINIDSGEIPSLDDDVVVHRLGQPTVVSGSPWKIVMNLKTDLGQHFHLNGKWVDTALTGAIQIRYVDRILSGTGALHSQMGYVDTWGQHLQLQHGNITFQGKLDNPLLDIEALRKGEVVEAGVHVSGTAKQPHVTLVSYPEVSEEEKISWLVLGRAPETGSDISLLMSVASIMLGEEPFYKQFGVDDIRIHSGAVGSSASLLPVQTVASGDRNQDLDSALASQILVASKHFANSLTLSIEQALSGAQTVGRLSYALSRRWSVDLKGGDVTGLALIYRAFIAE